MGRGGGFIEYGYYCMLIDYSNGSWLITLLICACVLPPHY
jgi:hypothetical protein